MRKHARTQAHARLNDLDYAMREYGIQTHSEKEAMTGGEIVFLVVEVLIAVAFFVVLIFGGQIFGPENTFYLSMNVFSDIANPNPWIRALAYVILIMSLSKFVRFIISKLMKVESLTRRSGAAIFELVRSLVQYGSIIALIFLVLGALGVDTTAILAGIGIFALIFGLGAKNLVEDLVAGFFIIVEHVYDVGDIVAVKGFRGSVKTIGLRTTQIEDVGGNIMNVRNSGVGDVINMTDLLSVAQCEIGIDDDAGKLLETEKLLERELPMLKDRIPELVDGPFYLGVEDVSRGITLSFVAKCEEGAKYRVERALKRELILLLHTNDDGGGKK